MPWKTINGNRVFIKPKGGAAVAAAVLAGGVAFAGGGAGSAGTAAESAVGQGLRAKTTNSKNAARKGQYDEAWRRMGLKSAKRTVEPKLKCVAHSYGQMREFFVRTPCRSLDRMLLAMGDGQGNTVSYSQRAHGCG